MIFRGNCFSCYILLTLTKFHWLIAFTSTDFEQYVYCNYVSPRLWRHKFWIQTYLSNQVVFLHDQKVKAKIEITWERKELLSEKLFKGFSVVKNCVRPQSALLKFGFLILWNGFVNTWAVVRRCSVNMVFLKVSQNSPVSEFLFKNPMGRMQVD